MRKEEKLKVNSYRCEKCKDTGWLPRHREDGSEFFISCECREREKLQRQWKASGISLESTKKTFSNFKIWNTSSQKARDSAMAYYKDFETRRSSRHNSIILCGQVGSGKTHLSIAIAFNFMNNNIKVVYMPYRDIVTKIKQNILDEDYYRKTIFKYQTCEVLLLDDLFKGKSSMTDINIIFEIINYRYLNYLPIIVSTEFSVEKLLSFDEGIASRIYEMCKEYIVEIPKEKNNNYRLSGS
jgi:DNA replication protein DnaC